MRLAEVSIRRPVLTIVISILITVFGLISLAKLGVREYPAVDPPRSPSRPAIPEPPPR